MNLIHAQGLHWQDGGEGAIYGYGMTNDFINNRMAGYMHGFWVPVRDTQAKLVNSKTRIFYVI